MPLVVLGALAAAAIVWFSIAATAAELWHTAWWTVLVAALFPLGLGYLVWRDRDR